jgi:hypothetical protein
MGDMIKLGNHIPTMYVTSKIEKTGTPMKINASDFNPKLHKKVDDKGVEVEPEVCPTPAAKAKPKAK